MRSIAFMLAFLPALAAVGQLPAAPAAELSPIYLEWSAGPAHYLFTAADREAWRRVADDQEAEAFIRLFWARRDPDPESAENEFRREFERRVAFADQRFGATVEDEPVAGSLTDRGRAFVLLGPPRRIQQPGAEGSTTGGDFGTGGGAFEGRDRSLEGSGPIGRGGTTERFGVASLEVWVYEGEGRPEFIKKKRLEVTFRTKPGTEEVELYRGEEAMGYMAEAIERAVVRPELTAADLAAGGGTLEAAGGGFGLFGAERLDDARVLEALRSSLAGGGAGTVPAHLDAGPFQAADGTWIVPVQVSVEHQTAAARTALIGELVDAAGESKVAFRVAVPWQESRGQRFLKATVVAGPGDYRLRTGLEAAGEGVVWSAERAVTVPDPGQKLWLSQVVLSEDIHPMPDAQEMLEPWAWMGIAVVPEGDRTFGPGTVLWHYLHVCYPALDEGGRPALRMTVQVTGPENFRGPAPVDPVKAGDNCWVLASAFELIPDRFPAGDYALEVSVRDSVAGTTLVAEPVSFTVAPPSG